ncbi:UNVERIFIED_CONTAM: hypothetical protein Slati_1914000 [Sesamum latifolium]|uniref:Uncharacterized protein n=1 Tax=Sesamum latifolium TaxID=2727402 RepID=A0AAW2X2S7_9LAMI
MPTVCSHYREDRATTPWANNPSTCKRWRKWDTGGCLRSTAPQTPRGAAQAETGLREQQKCPRDKVCKHRKTDFPARARWRLGRRLRRLARDVVAVASINS